MENIASNDGIPDEEEEGMSLELPEHETEFKFNFMKKFATKTGSLSRLELEELLAQKITESIRFRINNADLHERLERQTTINESNKKRLSIVTKQYQDLEMVYKRVLKDLNERPDAPIVPVKITRDVGLQICETATQQHTRPIKNRLTQPGPTNGNPHNFKRPATATLSAPLHTRPIKYRIQPQPLIGIPHNSKQNMQRTKVTAVKGSVPINKSSPSTSSSGINLTEGGSTTVQLETTPHSAVIRVGQNPKLQETRTAAITKPTIATANRTIVRARNVAFQYICTSGTNRVMVRHPAPLPFTPQQTKPGEKKIPPRPIVKVNKVPAGIIVTWTIEQLTAEHADIQTYRIYAYEETIDPPSLDKWKFIEEVLPLLLPMGATLTQFQGGQKYFFAVRAVDTYKRLGPFSSPQTW